MSSSTAVTQPGLPPTGLPPLVLSKRYLACAGPPPNLFKLEHGENCNGAGKDGCGCGGNGGNNGPVVDCWQPNAWVPSSSATVQARYEPSDVFTPLVFEEVQQQHHPQPSMWIRSSDRIPPSLQHLQSPQLLQPQPSQRYNAGGAQRRPLQHLPPPAQSPMLPHQKSADQQQRNGSCTKPGDLSWLVNFQVSSIFEPSCNGTAGGERQEPDTLKQKKRGVKTEQKTPTKINRKPYRMPPSRLDKANKPGYTYTEMIHQALMEKKELPVAEIYQWISSHFPYFREDDERWKNSVRHNLSINPNFRKGRKSQGAGHYWRLCNTEESLGQREFPAAVEEDAGSPQDTSELEQACKYLEGELQRENGLEDGDVQPNIDAELENEIYTNSFLISSPQKYVNEQIDVPNNNDFHSYGENMLEESIDFQYYNL